MSAPPMTCPTVGNMYDKLIPKGIYGVFGETSEITGAEHICKERAKTKKVGEKWYKMWKAYQCHRSDDAVRRVVAMLC
jgi:(2R)-sulfolactate sulfo-lyase subunit beta